MTITINITEAVNSKVESANNGTSRCDNCGPPVRIMIALICLATLSFRAAAQISMSVAIVDMVKVAPLLNGTSVPDMGDDVCPGVSPDTDGNPDGEFEWGETMQGAILSAPYFGFVGSQVLGGRMADRFGSRILICCSMVISGTMVSLTPILARTHVALVLGSRVIAGISGGFLTPSILLLISYWFPPEERSRFSGVIFSATDLGHLLGAGVSGILADWHGWSAVFYCFGGCILIMTIPCLLLVYDSPAKHPRITQHERQLIETALGRRATQAERKNVPWKAILTSPPFWVATFIQFGDTWVESTMVSELPTFTKNVLHFDIKESGYIAALPNVFALAASVCSGFIFHQLIDKKCMSKINVYRLFNAICTLGPAITLIMLVEAGCNSTVVVILIAVIISYGGYYSGSTYLNFMDLGANYSGTLSGLQQTIGVFPGLVTPMIAGYVVEDNQTLSAWHRVFFISAAVSALPLCTFMIFGSVEEQEWNRPKEIAEE